ncbi:MAG: bifunctional 5,10-methylenetetrahydrofolate dehydrogenase/5,10-methenyltetrahydrofolate cyclohydrolase [Verrucomicrobiota bacterium]
MELIDGNAVAKAVLADVAAEVAALQGKPCVTFVRVGEDPASVSYVNKKQRTAAEVGIESRLEILPENTSREELLNIIDKLNADPDVHGILVQSPIGQIKDEREIFNRVSPLKDVDGFNAANVGKLCQEDPTAFVACTPAGIIELLLRSGVETSGKRVAVVGRSLIVGKPVAMLMMQKGPGGDATVTVCHSRTQNLPAITREADILVAAIGRAHFITPDMVKDGAVVIDVGINRIEDASRKRGYRLVGDVDFEAVSPKCSKITPVPGGVGPMTVAMLMKNTAKAYTLNQS